jgi:xanthine dehydrogenase accessory factor
MVDRRRIVRQWLRGNASVLITLVRAEGSSYRRPGAHLLVGQDGEYSGTISGGCLEAEVVRKALWKVRDGACVERYSTLFDDTAEIPFGLGCGGVVDLLFEPVDTPECHALLTAMEASLHGSESVVATWLPDKQSPLLRAVLHPNHKIAFASATLPPEEIAPLSVTYQTSVHGSPDLRLDEGASDHRIALERLSTPQRLFVLGTGDDAKPVVTMASLLGWNVTVVDGRPQFARPQRFPEAERVLVASSVDGLQIGQHDAVVLMTHSYEQDLALLTGLLAGISSSPASIAVRPGYIGVLGARHRSSLLVSKAAASLGLSLAECCERICAPVGLDLGGDGPEAIALAVIAEVQAWTQGKLGLSRMLTPQDVAEHIAQGGSERYLQMQCPAGVSQPAVS